MNVTPDTLRKWSLLQPDQLFEFCCPLTALEFSPRRPDYLHPFNYISFPVQFDACSDDTVDVSSHSMPRPSSSFTDLVGLSSDDLVASLRRGFRERVLASPDTELFYSKRSAIRFILQTCGVAVVRESSRHLSRRSPSLSRTNAATVTPEFLTTCVRSSSRRVADLLSSVVFRSTSPTASPSGSRTSTPSHSHSRTRPSTARTRRRSGQTTPRRQRQRSRHSPSVSPAAQAHTRWTRSLRLSPSAPPLTGPVAVASFRNTNPVSISSSPSPTTTSATTTTTTTTSLLSSTLPETMPRTYKGTPLATLRLVPDRTKRRLAEKRQRKILSWTRHCDVGTLSHSFFETAEPLVISTLFSMALETLMFVDNETNEIDDFSSPSSSSGVGNEYELILRNGVAVLRELEMWVLRQMLEDYNDEVIQQSSTIMTTTRRSFDNVAVRLRMDEDEFDGLSNDAIQMLGEEEEEEEEEGEREMEEEVNCIRILPFVGPSRSLEWRILRHLRLNLADLEIRCGNYQEAIKLLLSTLFADLRSSFRLFVLGEEEKAEKQKEEASPLPMECLERVMRTIELWIADTQRRKDVGIGESLRSICELVEMARWGRLRIARRREEEEEVEQSSSMFDSSIEMIGLPTRLFLTAGSERADREDDDVVEWVTQWGCSAIDCLRSLGLATEDSFIRGFDEDVWGDIRVLLSDHVMMVEEDEDDDLHMLDRRLSHVTQSFLLDLDSDLEVSAANSSVLAQRLRSQLQTATDTLAKERTYHTNTQQTLRKLSATLDDTQRRNEGLMAESLSLHEDAVALTSENLALRRAIGRLVMHELGEDACSVFEREAGVPRGDHERILLRADVRPSNLDQFVSLGSRADFIAYSLFRCLTIRSERHSRSLDPAVPVSHFRHLTSLRDLTISDDSKLHDGLFPFVPHLERLKLWECSQFTGKGFPYIAKTLTILELYKVNTITDEMMSVLTNLRKLDLWLVRNLKGTCFRHFRRRLRTLTLNCVDQIDDEALGNLVNLQKLKVFKRPQITGDCFTSLQRLRDVTLAYNHHLDDPTLRTLIRCERLTLRECPRLLGKLPWRRSQNALKELTLEHCNSLTDEIFSGLIRLEKLILIQCLRLTGDGFEHLTRLKEISIYDHSRMSDDGLRNLRFVESVTLSRCNSVYGTCFRSMPTVQRLYVFKTHRFTDNVFPGLSNIAHLEMHQCSMFRGRGLEFCVSLKVFKVSDCLKFDGDQFFHFCVELEECEIENCSLFSGVGIVMLPKLVKLSVIGCPSVEVAVLENSSIPSIQVDYVDLRD